MVQDCPCSQRKKIKSQREKCQRKEGRRDEEREGRKKIFGNRFSFVAFWKLYQNFGGKKKHRAGNYILAAAKKQSMKMQKKVMPVELALTINSINSCKKR